MIGLMLMITAYVTMGRPNTKSFVSFCDDEQYEITWRDEFDGIEVDETKWNIVEDLSRDWSHFAFGRLALPQRSNVFVRDGILIMEARRQKTFNHSYTTGALDTRFKADWSKNETHRVCIRAKLPGVADADGLLGVNKGYFPALWMNPMTYQRTHPCLSDLGEVDMIEMVNGDCAMSHAYHFQKTYPEEVCQYPKNHGRRYSFWTLPDFDEDFQEYAVERTPTTVRFLVDGVVRLEVDAEKEPEVKLWDVPYYIVMNFAIGGTWPGAPTSQTRFPAHFQVDYVRVAHLKKNPNPN